MFARSLIFTGGLMLALAAHAGAYKWVDENGVTHYGDRPPKNTQAQILDLPKTPPPSVDEIASEDRAAACEQARQTLRQYETAVEVLRPDETGKQVPLSEAERDELIAQGRQRVTELCEEGE